MAKSRARRSSDPALEPEAGSGRPSAPVQNAAARTVDDRPGRLGPKRAARRPAIRSRGRRGSMSGCTSSRIPRSTPPGNRCSSAAHYSVRTGEPHPHPVQPALQHRDLMPQHQDLSVLLPVGHQKQKRHRERVRHGQVGQSQQHTAHHPGAEGSVVACPVTVPDLRRCPPDTTALTYADVLLGKHRATSVARVRRGSSAPEGGRAVTCWKPVYPSTG